MNDPKPAFYSLMFLTSPGRPFHWRNDINEVNVQVTANSQRGDFRGKEFVPEETRSTVGYFVLCVRLG